MLFAIIRRHGYMNLALTHAKAKAKKELRSERNIRSTCRKDIRRVWTYEHLLERPIDEECLIF